MSAIGSLWMATLILLLWGLTANPLSASSNARQESQIAKPTQSDLDSGKQTFNELCSGCHGPNATGGQAPNIQRAPATLGDEGVVRTIKNGLPGTGMPAFAGLSDVQAMQVVAYIRSLASIAMSERMNQVMGDPEEGKAMYNKSGCADCHTISGEGGDLGPDLTQIGSLRFPDDLRSALLNPGAELPKGGRIAHDQGLWTLYLMFRAVTKDGKTVEGMRVGEDSFDIVLEDSKGNFHSLRKPDLRTLKKETTKSFMPSFQGVFSATDLDNLVAYLASLKATQ
ncbi:MAG: c-type cytochrome [Candidatus Acidiferrales bacterium]